jgi:hypothetical protein
MPQELKLQTASNTPSAAPAIDSTTLSVSIAGLCADGSAERQSNCYLSVAASP